MNKIPPMTIFDYMEILGEIASQLEDINLFEAAKNCRNAINILEKTND